MAVSTYTELEAHLDHEVVVAGYLGLFDGSFERVNVAIECRTCNVVLLDYESPHLLLRGSVGR